MSIEGIRRARRPFGRTAVYVPREMPTAEIPWPKLRPPTAKPTKPSLLTYLPMALMSTLMPLMSVVTTGQPLTWGRVLTTAGMGLFIGGLFPLIQWWGYRRQEAQFRQQAEQRRAEFLAGLGQMHQQARALAEKQRAILEDRYPNAQRLMQIALDPKLQRRRLWAREPDRDDFLTLRLGTGDAPPAFTFASFPSFSPEDEALEEEAQRLLQSWTHVSSLPVVFPLLQTGSFLLKGSHDLVYGTLYRLIADIAVHHSPGAVKVGVIARDAARGQGQWSWMKWLPHTGVLEGRHPSLLAFSPDEGRQLVEHLARRLRPQQEGTDQNTQPLVRERDAVVLIFDEDGALRRDASVAALVERGFEVGVYLIFVGGAIHGVRAEVRLKSPDRFRYKAELRSLDGRRGERETVRSVGKVETLSAKQVERVARELASLEPPEPISAATLLPAHVPLHQLLAHVYTELQDELAFAPKNESSTDLNDPTEIFSTDIVHKLWSWFGRLTAVNDADTGTQAILIRRFLHLPVGLSVQKGQMRPLYLNLLPSGSPWNGWAAYHSILVGPTGSGKSEFLKALIWGAAYQYPPSLLNIFFVDFKGGAALEDLQYRHMTEAREIVTSLPHLVGMVTNSRAADPTLDTNAVARRGVQAILLETERRKHLITTQGRAGDIWEYNDKVLAARRGQTTQGVDPSLPLLPHLLVILDEYEEALSKFPEMEGILESLARIGRSLGMYLVLANQKYARMEKVEDNVSWRIALRMDEQAIRSFFGVRRPGVSQVGRGYLLCQPLEDVSLFQSAYGGVSLYRGQEEENQYQVYEIGPAGRSKILYQVTSALGEAHPGSTPAMLTQGHYLTAQICQLAKEHPQGTPPRQVYLEPLPADISLPEVLERYLQERFPQRQRAFDGEQWHTPNDEGLEAPFALVDNLSHVTYDVLSFPFHQGVGHLWVLGVTDSGKEDLVESLTLSLAHLYTPEQLWMYVLDFSSGHRLRALTALPHVGAHVLASDQERLRRLTRLWKEELERRKTRPHGRYPRWLWILHHAHRRELAAMDEEELASLIEDLISTGGRLGLHLLITSLHANALRPEVATNLRPRVVMDMGAREHFYDAGLARQASYRLTRRVPGRGFWLERLGDDPREMQAARWHNWESQAARMDEAWQGVRPPAVETLPDCLPWEKWATLQPMEEDAEDILPLGLNYDLEPVEVTIGPEQSQWLVAGPPGSGKTHVLMVWARTILAKPDPWPVYYLARKAPPEAWLPSQQDNFYMAAGADEAVVRAGWQRVAEYLQSEHAHPLVLLTDDAEEVLSLLEEATGKPLAEAMQQGRVIWALAIRSFNTFNRMITRLPYEVTSLGDILRQFPEARLGFITRLDENVLGVYNVQSRRLPREWRALWQDGPMGRGLLVYRDQQHLIHEPFLGTCRSS